MTKVELPNLIALILFGFGLLAKLLGAGGIAIDIAVTLGVAMVALSTVLKLRTWCGMSWLWVAATVAWAAVPPALLVELSDADSRAWPVQVAIAALALVWAVTVARLMWRWHGHSLRGAPQR